MDQQTSMRELKIVIVEDNVPLADIYKTRLELIGYKCFVAYDGQAALDIIERELPDLVLLDLMVPEVAGDEILKRMRQSEWGKHIRVFIISNLNEVDAPQGLRDLGIEGYVVKANLSNDQLDQLVDNILKPPNQTESTSLEEQSSVVKSNELPAQPTSDSGVQPGAADSEPFPAPPPTEASS